MNIYTFRKNAKAPPFCSVLFFLRASTELVFRFYCTKYNRRLSLDYNSNNKFGIVKSRFDYESNLDKDVSFHIFQEYMRRRVLNKIECLRKCQPRRGGMPMCAETRPHRSDFRKCEMEASRVNLLWKLLYYFANVPFHCFLKVPQKKLFIYYCAVINIEKQYYRPLTKAGRE